MATLPTAAQMAALARARAVSAREPVEAALGAVERFDPTLNAFVAVCAERALAEADDVRPGGDRPLAGLPASVKDAFTMALLSRQV